MSASVKKSTKSAVSKETLVRRINALTKGQSVTLPELGTVKCVLSAKESKDRKRRFSVSKSSVVNSRKKFTFGDLVSAFGLRG